MSHDHSESASDLRIVVVVGNPRQNSRTRSAATELAAALASRIEGVRGVPDVIDLAEFGPELLTTPPPASVNTALTTASEASILITATPVYKGSYTGLLKVFLDLLPAGALSRVVGVPVTVSRAASHRDAADVQLRPVLLNLGASLPVPSFTLEEDELPTVDTLAAEWATAHAPVAEATTRALRAGTEVAT